MYKYLKETLKEWDEIQFGSMTYWICSGCMYTTSGSNSKIFRLMGVDKYHFTTKSYGYKAGSGDRPTFKTDDYEAVSRYVDDIIDYIFTNNIKL